MDYPKGAIEPWTIRRGSKTIMFKHPLVAAPIAGGLDPPYRMVLHELDCILSYTEMISSRAVFEDARRTRQFFSWVPNTGFSGAQIFGSDPEYLSHAATEMEKAGHHIIDLNAGCPKRKVYRTGAGSAMLKDPGNLMKCAETILDSVKLPIGVKMRMGFHHLEEEVLKELILDLQSIGLSYISMHPRTMVQQYSGRADRDLISRMSRWLEIPLIASGDVRTPEDVADYIGRGASAVMVARGHLGDPTWIQRTISSLNGGIWYQRYPETLDQVDHHLTLLRKHLKYAVDWYGEERGIIEFRPHFGWYIKRFKGKSEFRDRIYSLKTSSETMDLVNELEKQWSGSFQND